MNRTNGKKASFRIKYTDGMGNEHFITRHNGRVFHFNSSKIHLALSNVAGNNAATLSFALADADTGAEAAKAVREFGVYARSVDLIRA